MRILLVKMKIAAICTLAGESIREILGLLAWFEQVQFSIALDSSTMRQNNVLYGEENKGVV